MLEHNIGVLCRSLNGISATTDDHMVKHVPGVLSNRDEEMLRLIGQYLCDKGFNAAYVQLSRESGIDLEHRDATELRHAVLEGRWIDAETAIDKLAPMVGDPNSVEEVRFLLLEQRFLEHLEANEVMPAVTLLRNRITPMQRNTERVHTLASCLMCRTLAELRAQAGGWAGIEAGSRLQLINRIQSFIPAQTMLPPRRLEELINESVRSQLAACIFHNPPLGMQTDLKSISLLQRHSCGMQDFPAFCVQTLDQRDSDLWYCQFSPDGNYLASGGKDTNVDIWRVDPIRHAVSFFRVLNTLSYIGCLCWSPDSKKLAICCGEEQSSVIVYDVFSGQQLCNQKVNDEDVYSSATFFADSRKLAFGGLKGSFYVMDTEDQGRILTMVEGYRVQSMAAVLPPMPSTLLPSGTELVQVNPAPPNRTIPGAPDSSLTNNRQENGVNFTFCDPNNCQIDQLIIADSLHRIRLFRFGPIGQANAQTNLISTATETTTTDTPTLVSTSTEAVSTTVAAVTIPTPVTTFSDSPSTDSGLTSTSSSLTVHLSSTSLPGAPNLSTSLGGADVSTGISTRAALSTDNPAVATALTVACLAQQQRQRLIQNNPGLVSGSPSSSSSSGPPLSWYHQSTIPGSLSSSSSFTTTASGLPPGILLDMPILPVSLTRIGSHQSQAAQTRPLLRHAGTMHGGNPYAFVSTPGGGNVGPTGSSLTILFGTPLERTALSTSSIASTSSTTTGMTTLTSTAAAVAGSHSRSFAGFVHSLSGAMVATTEVESGVGGAIHSSSTSEIGINTTPTTTSSTGVGSASNLPTTTTSTQLSTTVGFSTTNTLTNSNDLLNNGVSYGLLDHRTLFKETHPVQSITLSRSGNRALITIHKMGLHLWDVVACAILQRFVGHKQNTFRLCSTFGGANEDFVATGSENGRVHIWHTTAGSHPIHSTASSGNRDPITCVHWNPALPTMIASVSDSGELCIWGPQRFVLGTGQPMDAS